MKEKIFEDEEAFFECWYNPLCLVECLFHDFDNLGNFDEEKLGDIRLYQTTLLSLEGLVDFESDKTINKKEQFRRRKRVGDLLVYGARRYGKSLIVEKLNIALSVLYDDNMKTACSSADSIHVNGILDDVRKGFDHHPILKKWIIKIVKTPNWSVIARNGWTLDGVNQNIGSKQPGQQWFGKHVHKAWLEEQSLENQEAYDTRKDAVSELGCIYQIASMTNFTKLSPAGQIFYEPDTKVNVINLPQYVNPLFDAKEREKKIKEHGGQECFDAKTEMLTDSGWKTYNTITKNDKVLSLDVNTNKASYSKINNVFVYDYDGIMYGAKQYGLDFLISPKHKMLIKTLKSNWKLVDMQTIINNKPIRDYKPIKSTVDCNYCGKKLNKIKKQKHFCSKRCSSKFYTYFYYPINKFKVKRDFEFIGKKTKKIKIISDSKNAKTYIFNIDDWVEFLGWFISEGNVYKHNRKKYSNFDYFLNTNLRYYVNISQSETANPEKVQKIKNLLTRMKLNFTYSSDKFYFTSKAIGEHLIEECGHLAHNKKIPIYIKNLNKECLKILLNALVLGDGHYESDKLFCYATVSKQLADDVQEIIYKIGDTAHIYTDELEDLNHKTIYRVRNRSKRKELVVYRKNILPFNYNGKIWCVETNPNHTVFVKRNDKCHWSGNSLQYKIFVKGEIVEDGITEFDPERLNRCYMLKRSIKRFEITKKNFSFFENLIVVERPKNISSLYICADVGDGAGGSELIIISDTNDMYRYLYNITLYNLKESEQIQIFKYLIRELQVDIVGIDCGDALGRGLADQLEKVIGKENVFQYQGNRKVEIGFLEDEKGNTIIKNARPMMKEERMSEWCVRCLKNVLYEEKIQIPTDHKLDKQLNYVVSTQSGARRIYTCLCPDGDHLWDAFKIFGITQWAKKLNLKPKPRNIDWCIGVV